MRITLVSPYSLDMPGGVQGQVLGLAAALAAFGEQVTVIAPGTPTGLLSRPPNVELGLIGKTLSIPVNGSRAPIALSPRAARLALGLARESVPNVIHLHEPLVPMTSLALLHGHIAPTLGTFHRSGAGVGYRLIAPVASRMVGRLERGAVVSEAARATIRQVIGERAKTYALVPNGVDVSRFIGAVPWPTEIPTAVFVGRHEPRKGLGVLLEAFSQVEGNVRLWVIGSGRETSAMKGRYEADTRIEWLGRVDDNEVARRLAGARLFVAPSLGGESFGVVLLEAMAAGTPVLCSDLEGYRLTGGDIPFYVPPNNPSALRTALRELLSGTQPFGDRVERGIARAERYSFSSLATAYLELYREATGV